MANSVGMMRRWVAVGDRLIPPGPRRCGLVGRHRGARRNGDGRPPGPGRARSPCKRLFRRTRNSSKHIPSDAPRRLRSGVTRVR